MEWLSSVNEGGSDSGCMAGAEYQAVAGGSVTVYVDSGKSLMGPTLGSGAGYSRVCESVIEWVCTVHAGI